MAAQRAAVRLTMATTTGFAAQQRYSRHGSCVQKYCMSLLLYLLVDWHKNSAGCLAFAAGDGSISFHPQGSAVLLFPPMSSDDAHNPPAWLLSAGSLQLPRVLLVLYCRLCGQLRHQVLCGSVVFSATLANRSVILKTGSEDQTKNNHAAPLARKCNRSPFNTRRYSKMKPA